jgi:hypothetical protein
LHTHHPRLGPEVRAEEVHATVRIRNDGYESFIV